MKRLQLDRFARREGVPTFGRGDVIVNVEKSIFIAIKQLEAAERRPTQTTLLES